MQHVIRAMLLMFTLTHLSACSQKAYPVYFMCNDTKVEIYADGNYIGNGGPLKYTVLPGTKQVEVQCFVDGVSVFTRTFNVDGMKNEMFQINIPNRMRYHTN